MHKRGKESLDLLIVMIVAVAVTFAAINWVNNEVGDSSFEREFFSKDAALVMEAITGAQGEINFRYDATSKHDLEFYFDPGKVEVYEFSMQPRESRAGYDTLFARNSLIEENTERVSDDIFVIKKNESEIEVKKWTKEDK